MGMNKSLVARELEYEKLKEEAEKNDLVIIKKNQSQAYQISLSAFHFDKIKNKKFKQDVYQKIISSIYSEEGSNQDVKIHLSEIIEELKNSSYIEAILEYVSDNKKLNIKKIDLSGEQEWVFFQKVASEERYFTLVKTYTINDQFDKEGKLVGLNIDILLSMVQEIKEEQEGGKLSPLELPPIKSEPANFGMMMYGRKKRQKLVYDSEGKKVPDGYTKSGKIKYLKESYYVNLVPGVDKGIYPSVNEIYVGRGIYSENAREKKKEWEQTIMEWADLNGWELAEKGVQVYADYHFYMPNDKITRDTHNLFKMHIDSLEGIIAENDKDILPRVQSLNKVEKGQEPYFEVYFSLVK